MHIAYLEGDKVKQILSITFICILFSISVFAAENINPMTGEAVKPITDVKTNKPKDSPAPNANAPRPGNIPFIPAPNTSSMPYNFSPVMPMNQQNQKVTTDKPGKKEIKPTERYVIDGIVDDTITVRDLLNEEKIIYVNDLTILDNGCFVKYPFILCGKQADKALRSIEDKDELSKKVLHLSKENGELQKKISAISKQIAYYENKIQQLEPKINNTDKTLERYKTEKQQLTNEIASLNNKIIDITKSKDELNNKLLSLEPQVAKFKNETDAAKSESKESLSDLSSLTSVIYTSQLGTDYNIPKIGKFKGVLLNNNIYAFVPIEQREKADAYFNKTLIRAYKTDKYVLYINNKKLVED